MKNKKYLIITLLFISLSITACNNKEAVDEIKNKPRLMTTKDSGIKNEYNYKQIINKETGETKYLKEDDKNIKDIIDFTKNYIYENKQFDKSNIKEVLMKEFDFLSKEAKEALENKRKKMSIKEITKEKEKNDLIIKNTNDLDVKVSIIKLDDIKNILISPSGENALVFAEYEYSIIKKIDSDKEIEDDLYEEQLLKNTILLNLKKEEEEWKIYKILDGKNKINDVELIN